MTTSLASSPCVTAFSRLVAFPDAVLGPVECRELRRFASIFFLETTFAAGLGIPLDPRVKSGTIFLFSAFVFSLFIALCSLLVMYRSWCAAHRQVCAPLPGAGGCRCPPWAGSNPGLDVLCPLRRRLPGLS